MADSPALRSLVERIAAFHVTDRAMLRAQGAIEQAFAAGEVDESSRRAYLAAARRYFDGFRNEARSGLRDVDRRLSELAQVQFNLAAERAVAVKRIEVTGEVLAELDRLEETDPS